MKIETYNKIKATMGYIFIMLLVCFMFFSITAEHGFRGLIHFIVALAFLLVFLTIAFIIIYIDDLITHKLDRGNDDSQM